MYKVLKRTCRAIVLPIRSFVFHVLVAAAVVVCLSSLLTKLVLRRMNEW